MNSSTKIIHIGKKKRIKKTVLDEFIPRYTEKDVSKNNIFIDNSFELKKYKSKQCKEKEKEATHRKKEEATFIKKEEDTRKQYITVVHPSPKVNLPPKHIQKDITTSTPIQSISTTQLLGNTSHKQNINNIIQQYNSKKNINKDIDTESIYSHSSLIDIMSMVDMTPSELEFIKNTETTYTPQIYSADIKQIKDYSTNSINLPKQSKYQSQLSPQAKQPKQPKQPKQYQKKTTTDTFNTHYQKYYSLQTNIETFHIPVSNTSCVQTKKHINRRNILKKKKILVKYGIINDLYSDIPEKLILDFYAMLSDDKCSFNINQL